MRQPENAVLRAVLSLSNDEKTAIVAQLGKSGAAKKLVDEEEQRSVTPVGFPHLCDKAKKDLMSRPAKRDTYSSRDTSIAGYSSAFPVLLVGWQIKPQDFAAAAEPDAQTAHADGECACGARHVGRGTPRVAVSCGHGYAARRRSSCANVPNPYTASRPALIPRLTLRLSHSSAPRGGGCALFRGGLAPSARRGLALRLSSESGGGASSSFETLDTFGHYDFRFPSATGGAMLSTRERARARAPVRRRHACASTQPLPTSSTHMSSVRMRMRMRRAACRSAALRSAQQSAPRGHWH